MLQSKGSSTPLLQKKSKPNRQNNLKFWFIIPLVCIVALIYIALHGGLSPQPLVQTPESSYIEEPSHDDLTRLMQRHEHQTITVYYNSYEMYQAIGHAEPGSFEWIDFHSKLLEDAGYDHDKVMSDPDLTIRFEVHDNNHMDFDEKVVVETRQPKHGHMVSEAARYRSLTINKHSIAGGPGLVYTPPGHDKKAENKEDTTANKQDEEDNTTDDLDDGTGEDDDMDEGDDDDEDAEDFDEGNDDDYDHDEGNEDNGENDDDLDADKQKKKKDEESNGNGYGSPSTTTILPGPMPITTKSASRTTAAATTKAPEVTIIPPTLTSKAPQHKTTEGHRTTEPPLAPNSARAPCAKAYDFCALSERK